MLRSVLEILIWEALETLKLSLDAIEGKILSDIQVWAFKRNASAIMELGTENLGNHSLRSCADFPVAIYRTRGDSFYPFILIVRIGFRRREHLGAVAAQQVWTRDRF